MSFSCVFPWTGEQERTGLAIFLVLKLNNHVAPKVIRWLTCFDANMN